VYDQQLFSTKDELFKSKEFLQEEKEIFTQLRNVGVTDEKQKLQVFKSNGMSLPTKKIGKKMETDQDCLEELSNKL